MGTGRPRWKLTSSPRNSPSPSTSPSSSFVTGEPPAEFLCPISGSLMADPVIVPSGDTFERSCIQACASLSFTPPSLSSSSHSFSSSPLFLIPNVALRTSILNWCDQFHLPRPTPLSPATAHDIVRRLIPQKEAPKETPSPITPPPFSVRKKKEESIPYVSPPTSTRSNKFPSSSSSMEDEEYMFNKLINSEEESEQEEAAASLRQATREGRERRVSLCTPRLLAALRPMLLSRNAAIQTNAAAVVVNLSLEASNKAKIVRSGAVSPLIEVLKSGNPEARDNAAGAIYSLALEDENRATIGVLGAIPPLIQLLASGSDGYRARRDAGMALHHVSLAGMNQPKIAKTPGAVRSLLTVMAARDAAAPAEAAALRRLAMMVVANLAVCAEGRAALMDGGTVAAVVDAMREGTASRGTAEEEYCLSALYRMSRGSLRFRGLARAAGAERVLMRVAEESVGGGGGGGVRRETARKTLRAMKGEDDAVGFGEEYDDGSVVSEGLMSFPMRYRDYGASSGSNTAQF
ncbi:U-box domain-containing protein 39-like [Typha latifolia]|uniref:U-box domain-containing protein 39-like n=1 Tax=Typha latifolia TaxID=4733 RepID=UPI003C2CF1CD